jgi:hypothetical protein
MLLHLNYCHLIKPEYATIKKTKKTGNLERGGGFHLDNAFYSTEVYHIYSLDMCVSSGLL